MRKTRIFLLIAAGLLIVPHIPFLQSDPDRFISASRDANTDEGQYTYQIRNFIYHGEMAFKSSGCIAVSPLFSALSAVHFKAFGAHLMTARLFLLLLSLSILILSFTRDVYWQKFFVIAAMVTFLQYYIFHYAHFALPEFLSIALIFAAIIIAIEGVMMESARRSALISSVLVSSAYYLKLQFLPALIILPVSLIINIWLKGFERKHVFTQLKYTILFQSIFLLLILTCWYLPNKTFFEYIHQTRFSNVFSDFHNLKSTLHFNWLYVLQSQFLKVYSFAFFIALLPGIILFFRSGSRRYKAAFIFLGVWLASESYKLAMIYLPSRYLLSLIFPMSLFIALVLYELILICKTGAWNILRWTCVVVVLFFAVMNCIHYSYSFSRREFNIKKINSYLSELNLYKRIVIGSWAPSLTWESRSFTFPLWNNVFYDEDVLRKYKPSLIIAEEDEKDSDRAFISKGINLESLADSVKRFEVNGYHLKLYWFSREKTGRQRDY